MSIPVATSLDELMNDLPKVGGKKSDLVYAALKKAILFRLCPPDSQLLETELAGRFGCSQGTIREALLRLDDDGLVRRSGYRGTRVTETSPEEAVEMVRIRLSIERGVARKIATADISQHSDTLDDLILQMADAHKKGDLYRGSELDRSFHCALANAAGMDLLSPLLLRCALHIHRFTLGSVEVPRYFFQEAGVDAEHRALLQQLTCGDPDRAEAAISAHLAHVLSRWTPSLYEAVGPDVFSTLRK